MAVGLSNTEKGALKGFCSGLLICPSLYQIVVYKMLLVVG